MRRFSVHRNNDRVSSLTNGGKDTTINPRLQGYLPQQPQQDVDTRSQAAQSFMLSDAESTHSKSSDGEQEVRAFLWACANGKHNIVAAFVRGGEGRQRSESNVSTLSVLGRGGGGGGGGKPRQVRHMAGMLRNPDVAKALLNNKHVSASVKNNAAIGIACKKGHIGVLNILLECDDTDPGARGNYAIQAASENGYVRVVERLMVGLKSKLVDPSANCNFAIQAASFAGHADVVKALLSDPRVDPGSAQNYCLRFACENGHLGTVECLLRDSRVDPSAMDNAAIRWAAANGHRRVVQVLLNDERVDSSACDSDAETWATKNGHNAVVALLANHTRVV